jgi:ubiquinone/menaquinone biosynthesis C-methylase UbiE
MNGDLRIRELLDASGAEPAISRAILESQFDDPAHPLHPCRALHRAAMAELSQEPLAGKHVLHYRSGTAELGIWMATESAEVHLLDPSPDAVDLGLKRAQASGVARRVKAIQLNDPASLDMFADEAFELIFTEAPLAELVESTGALQEIARIMKPDARLVLAQSEAPARAGLTALERLFTEVQIQTITAHKGLLARLLPSTGPVVITALK